MGQVQLSPEKAVPLVRGESRPVAREVAVGSLSVRIYCGDRMSASLVTSQSDALTSESHLMQQGGFELLLFFPLLLPSWPAHTIQAVF